MAFGDAAREALFNENYPKWIGEAYGASGLGVSGVTVFIVFLGALGLFNWTESFKVPAVWLAIMSPLVAATLPAPVVMRLMGIVTIAVAMLFVALWTVWQRT